MIKLVMWGVVVAMGCMAYVQVVRDLQCDAEPKILFGRWDGTK